MNEGLDWLETYQHTSLQLQRLSGQLGYLSDCFYDTGNRSMALRLSAISANLQDMSEHLTHATNEVTSIMMHRAQEATFNMMNGIMAGMKIVQEEEGRGKAEAG